MKKTYYAVVHEEDGMVWCQFVDLPECIVQGEDANVEKLLESAAIVCNDLITLNLENGIKPPVPCDFSTARQFAENEALVLIDVELPSPTVRINITIPEDKLVLIDKAARRFRMNRSAFLVKSALTAIQ